MNWTGGNLNRHSKANANAVLRAQKQHFAKVRLQSRIPKPTPSLSLFSIFKTQNHSIRPSSREKVNREPDSIPATNELIEKKTPSLDAKGNQYDSREFNHQSRSLATRTRINSAINQSAKPKSIDQIKLSLLGTSDWVGLASTKPVKMTFIAAGEMRSLGRRRNIAHQDRQETSSMKKHKRTNNRQPLSFRRSFLRQRTSDLGTQDVSIRIGSNIHHTQTTQNNDSNVRDCSGEMKSRRGMEKDFMTSDLSRPFPNQDNVALIEESTARSHDLNVEPDETAQVLIPLDEARHFKSFDQVRKRSSSLKDQNSNQYGQSPNMKTLQTSETRSYCFPTSSLFHSGPKIKWGHDPNGIQQSQAWEPVSCQSHWSDSTESSICGSSFMIDEMDEEESLIPFPPSKTQCPLPTTESLSLSHTVQAAQKRFTLDDQVLLENAVCRDGGPSLKNCSLVSNTTRSSHCPPRKSLSNGNNLLRTTSNGDNGESKPVSIRDRFMAAKNCQDQGNVPDHPSSLSLPTDGLSVGDENEAWMREVFPQDFNAIQHGFEFGKASSPVKSNNYSLQLHDNKSNLATGVNTTIFAPSQSRLVDADDNKSSAHETDFLTQFSPMEGIMDERLASLSTYNNAAKTEHFSDPQNSPFFERMKLLHTSSPSDLSSNFFIHSPMPHRQESTARCIQRWNTFPSLPRQTC